MRTREIKFRAWDKITKKWASNLSWNFMEDAVKHSDNERYEFVQFTGLKDKNGVEIYEGDIVKWQNLNTLEKEIRITPVSLHSLGDGKNHVIEAYYPFCNTISGSYKENHREIVECYITPPDDCEIIGNIYENPELLTNESK